MSKTLLLLFINCLFAFAPNNNQGELTINISNIKEGTGKVLISLYQHPDGFPYTPDKVFSLDKSEISNNTASFNIEKLEVGTYAITLLDDENNNGDMDYNFLGIPKEGYGFSNNAKARGFSPPTFEDCTFVVKEGTSYIDIKVKYW